MTTEEQPVILLQIVAQVVTLKTISVMSEFGKRWVFTNKKMQPPARAVTGNKLNRETIDLLVFINIFTSHIH